METITQSAKGTKSLGQKLAATLKGGETLSLVGDLGSGKTTFLQGLAEGLGVKGNVISPTFILMRDYKAENRENKVGHFYHLDLYRLEENIGQEVKNLGINDLWGKKENIVAIEWGEKIKEMLPKETVWIEFENIGEDKRKIIIKDS